MIDHSSANSFLSDLLDKYRGSVFRFKFHDGGLSPQWRVNPLATISNVWNLQPFDSRPVTLSIPIKYGTTAWTHEHVEWVSVALDGAGGAMINGCRGVVILDSWKISADDSLQRRLNGNLRGVFA